MTPKGRGGPRVSPTRPTSDLQESLERAKVLFRAWGAQGGRTRAKRLTSEERSEAARKAVQVGGDPRAEHPGEAGGVGPDARGDAGDPAGDSAVGVRSGVAGVRRNFF